MPSFARRSSGKSFCRMVLSMVGKTKAPTKSEKDFMGKLCLLGCIICGNTSRCSVHHIVEGGKRKGHDFAIPLCYEHHQAGMGEGAYISRHPWKARFEEKYGDEQILLAKAYRLMRSEYSVELPEPVKEWIGEFGRAVYYDSAALALFNEEHLPWQATDS